MNCLWVERGNGLARITLNRPPLNVIDIPMMEELQAALDAVRGDPSAKILIVDANGKMFSAGVDVKDHTADRIGEMLTKFHAVLRTLWSLEMPTLAAVRGSALGGGCELAMACDFIVASEGAKFGQPEIQVGAFPPVAATILPLLIPEKKALEMILTGDSVDAVTAERWGLVNVVAKSEEFGAAVDSFSARLTRLSSAVVKVAKRATRLSLSMTEVEHKLQEIERIYIAELMKTHDAKEGIAAFIEKRKPEWKDR